MGRRRFQCHMQQMSRPTLAFKYPQMQQVSVHDELFSYNTKVQRKAGKARLAKKGLMVTHIYQKICEKKKFNQGFSG